MENKFDREDGRKFMEIEMNFLINVIRQTMNWEH